MSDMQIPVQPKKTLLKASGIAAVIAAVVSTCFILPAEFNIDPTGIGGALGLTSLSGDEPAATEATGKITYFTKDMGAYKKEIVIVHVPAGKGVEYKFDIAKGEKLQFSWTARGD